MLEDVLMWGSKKGSEGKGTATLKHVSVLVETASYMLQGGGATLLYYFS